MTEPFVQNADNTNEHASNDNAPFVDNANSQGAGDDNVDTKSVEYQLKVVQQRIEDKDNFIETLKGETKELRDTISLMEQRMASVEEIKKALKNNSQNVDNQNTNIDSWEGRLAGQH